MQDVGHKSMLCTVVPYNPAMLNYLLSIAILLKTIRLPIVSYAYVANSFQFCLPTLLYLAICTYNIQCPLPIAKSPIAT